MFRLEDIADELRDVVATLDAPTHSSRDAARLTKVAAEGEKLFAAAKVLLARRAVDGNGWRAGSDAILPEQWFARLSGCSESEARRELRMSERLDALPATEAKLREGSLSLDQAALVARGAGVDPSAETRLLRTARKGEMRNLRAETERVVAAAADDAEGRAAAHRDRHVRTWTRGFATEGGGPVPVEHARKVLSHGLLELVITDGVDVQTVASTTRHVPKALKIAIVARRAGAWVPGGADRSGAVGIGAGQALSSFTS